MSADTSISAADIPESSIPARYWEKLDDGRILCTLCPRACKLQEGQRGLCFVRARHNDQMLLTTYGRSSGFCIDPIEKKPLNHFLPGTPVLSFGTAGCNLTCKFCQNWDISKSRQMDRLMSHATPAMIAEAARQSKCRAVAYTYNDPIIFIEYAIDIAKECRKRNIKNVAVTAGYITSSARADFFDAMDAVNLDIKAFTPEFYKKLCAADLENVKETAAYLAHKPDVWLEITTLLIPDENDGVEELQKFCAWYGETLGPDVPLHFTAFHPDYKMRDKPRTPLSTLLRAREIALKAGLRYVYCGNVHDPQSAATRCPSCQSTVIGRDWHKLLSWGLGQGGHCTSCGHPVPGVFEPRPGNWGAKRVPVRFRPKPPNPVSSSASSSTPAPATPPAQTPS